MEKETKTADDTQNETQIKKDPPAQPKVEEKAKGNSSKVFLLILIVVVILAVLGVGGYFAYKYASGKLLNKLTGDSGQTENTEKTEGTTSVKSIIGTLFYPNSTILDQQQNKDSVYVAELTLSSGDGVDTIKNYYLNLIEEEKWTITRQGSTDSFDNCYLTFSDGIFTDELDITRYELDDYTTIKHGISGESLKADGLYVPSGNSSSSGASSSSNSSSNSSATTSTATTSGDYIISDSNSREISKSELTNFTPWQLKVARNEIYARHGRPFVHEDLQCYFATKSWYSSDSNYDVSSVSYLENKNIAIIQAYEQETNSPLASFDSGCNTNQ